MSGAIKIYWLFVRIHPDYKKINYLIFHSIIWVIIFAQFFSIIESIGKVQNQLIDINQYFISHRSGNKAPTTYQIKKLKNIFIKKNLTLKVSQLFTLYR